MHKVSRVNGKYNVLSVQMKYQSCSYFDDGAFAKVAMGLPVILSLKNQPRLHHIIGRVQY